jgi:hypothetical protein
VQDKIPLRLREEIPETPEELFAHPELAPVGVGVADDGMMAAAGPTEPDHEPTA